MSAEPGLVPTILEVPAGELRPGDVLTEGEVVREVSVCCGSTYADVGIAEGGQWAFGHYSGRWRNVRERRWRSIERVRVARLVEPPREVEV